MEQKRVSEKAQDPEDAGHDFSGTIQHSLKLLLIQILHSNIIICKT